MSAYKFSVVVPVFNSSEYLASCIDSLLNQRYKNFEVIFVDDGSSDDSVGVINKYVEIDPRIRLISQENQGAAAARNKGLKYATGDYVLFLDSDDWLDVRALEKINSLLSKKSADLLLYGYKWVSSESEGRNSSLDKLDALTSGNVFKINEAREELIKVFTGIAGKVLKRSVLETKRLRIPIELRNAEDTVFYLSVLVNFDSCVILNEELYYYRHPTGRQTLTSTGRVCDIAKACDYAVAKFGQIIPEDIIVGRFLTTLLYTYNFPSNVKTLSDLQIIRKYADIVLRSGRSYTQEEMLKTFFKTEYSIKGFLRRFIQFKFYGQIRDVYLCGFTLHLPRVKTIFLKRKIENYQKSVLQRIIAKLESGGRLKAVFLVNEFAKFKVGNLIQLMLKDGRFDVLIVIAPLAKNYNSQRAELQKIQDYFESKGCNFVLGYNESTGECIDLRRFNPDLVFYQQPWAQQKYHQIQNVVKFALTYYIPYYVPNYGNTHYDCMDFHKYLFRYYVVNQEYANIFKPVLFPFVNSIKPVGHPIIDEILSAQSINNRTNLVIYAPHFSLGKGEIGYGTFTWSGFPILEFAKKHQELQWVFKPHPRLSRELVNKRLMSRENVEKYFAEWANIGQVYEGPDYKNFFKNSVCMITDCGSFLVEYSFTGKPLIHLVSGFAHQPCYPLRKILNNYYQVYSFSELEEIMEKVLIKRIDNKKNAREYQLAQQLNSKTASLQILEDINSTFPL